MRWQRQERSAPSTTRSACRRTHRRAPARTDDRGEVELTALARADLEVRVETLEVGLDTRKLGTRITTKNGPISICTPSVSSADERAIELSPLITRMPVESGPTSSMNGEHFVGDMPPVRRWGPLRRHLEPSATREIIGRMVADYPTTSDQSWSGGRCEEVNVGGCGVVDDPVVGVVVSSPDESLGGSPASSVVQHELDPGRSIGIRSCEMPLRTLCMSSAAGALRRRPRRTRVELSQG